MFLLKLFILLLPVLRSASWEVAKISLDRDPSNFTVWALANKDNLFPDAGHDTRGTSRWPQYPCRFSAVDKNKPADTKLLIQNYKLDLNASRILQKNDRKLMLSWADEYQIKRLDVTMKYRLQMVKHQEHSLKRNGDVKWIDCLYIQRKEIRRSIRFYHENEHECLKTATSKDAETKEDVEQLEKQIVKWRKGYRYLTNLCSNENPGNEEMAQQCLIEYMQNDNYDEVIQRLMLLKQGAMSDLYAYFNSTLVELEECLRSQLSRYLDRIRSVMDSLNKCYSMIT